MKKTTFYKIGALSLALLSAGVFTSFDDAMTDEQKITAAYDQMVIEYKAEQTELCKSQALAMAQAEWARRQAEMASGDGTEVPPAYSGGSDRPSRNTGGSNTGGNEQPTTSTGGNTDTKPTKDPNSATTKGGSTQQGTGSASTKGGAVKQGGDAKSGENNASNKGGAIKRK